MMQSSNTLFLHFDVTNGVKSRFPVSIEEAADAGRF